MTGWFLRLELVNPVPDENLEQVRQHLLDTLEAAGWPAKSTTAEWSLVELARRPPLPLRPRSKTTLLPRARYVR